VAEDQAGALVCLAAVIIDTELALIAYHASVPDHALRSDARWLLSVHILHEVIRRGARVVLVESGPLSLESGLEYYQRRLGFTVVSLRSRRGAVA
jgi:hypothetical protein